MTRLSQLNKLTQFIIFFTILIFESTLATAAVDIWEKKENKNEKITTEKEITIESPILSDDINKITIKID